MKKVLAVLMAVARSVFLAFIIWSSVSALPMFVNMPTGALLPYADCTRIRERAQKVAWYATAWIAAETVLGWWIVVRKFKERTAPPTANTPSAPPV